MNKWSIAAAILVSVGIITFLVMNISKTSTVDVAGVTKIDTATDISSIAPEYAPEVNEFAKLIVLKQEELKALAPEQPELYRQIYDRY